MNAPDTLRPTSTASVGPCARQTPIPPTELAHYAAVATTKLCPRLTQELSMAYAGIQQYACYLRPRLPEYPILRVPTISLLLLAEGKTS